MAIPREEHALLSHLDNLHSEAKKVTDAVSTNWDSYIDTYKGRSWRGTRPPHFTANATEFVVNQKVALLTESKPDIQIIALKTGMTRTSEVIEQTIRALWDENHVQSELERLALNGAVLGNGFVETTWDSRANGGLGNIIISSLDPRTVSFDPFVTDISRLADAQYIIIEKVMTLQEIRLRYPGRGQLVTAESNLGPPTRAHTGIKSPTSHISSVAHLPGKPQSTDAIPRATVKIYWLRDDQLDPATGKPMFPNGRFIVRGGNIILADDQNPFWDGNFPIDGFNWDIDIEHAWGRGEVQRFTRIQNSIDRIGDSLVRNMLINNNTVLIGDNDALDPDQWKTLTNIEGLIIKKRAGREFTRQAPPVLPPEFFGIPRQLIDLISMLSGMREVVQGTRPGGITSGVAVEGLQQSALTLVRRVARNLETTMCGVGQKLISRIFQFFNSDRMLMRVGQNEDWQSYAFSRKELLQQVLINGDGSPVPTEDIGLRLRSAFNDFRFLIRPGSSLAQSRIQRGIQAISLFQLGLIDDEEVMRVVEWPDRDAVLQRAKIKQAASGQMPRTGSAQAQRRVASSLEKLGGQG
ncbi:MAG: hypothetical protein ACE5H7_13965 [Acidiferrobacterales bacterium]